MKGFKRISVIFIAVMFVFISAGALIGCEGEGEGETMWTDYFVYGCINKAGSKRIVSNGENVVILELTELGKQQERLIIPDYIDNKPVVQIGMVRFGRNTGIKGGARYKKLYLPINTLSIPSFDGLYAYHNTKILVINVSDFTFFQKHTGIFYLSEYLYYEIANISSEPLRETLKIANINYMSNTEVYFIDDNKNGEVLVKPTDPISDSQIFEGWFTEPEYVNEWDFENDVFHPKDDGTTMKLYAKWR